MVSPSSLHVKKVSNVFGCNVKQIFAEGVVQRGDLYITSKLWNTDHAAERVAKAFQKSLSNLKVRHV